MIGNKIKEMRKRKGYSISELAKLADVSKSYLSQIERGLQSNPSLQFLEKIAEPLETSLDSLIMDIRTQGHSITELDEEWKKLIERAIKDGLKKEDFQEYLNYIKYKTWIKEQNKS
ncbi:helix-turn-helix domain-containing protein [Neobacillus jeddahensis]|uniref:helix-turn-helix domain-containing protein n=1 Tax=Neobacillus jeddahensis TaxID=1461580 RepID=UPI00058B5134|nr:helix-turn-helix domain-containing protein [Neobacillus jeddahensis]